MILGNIVKTAIDVKDWLTTESDIAAAQSAVLKNLLEKAKETAFGKAHNFDTMIDKEPKAMVDAYQKNVSICDYERMYDDWWHLVIDGKEDITWPGATEYFALSSGTTGSESKRIPVTDDMITAIRSTGIKQATSLANFDLPAEFFETGVLMLGSSTDLTYKNGHLEGEISGITASNIPNWFKGFYKPGEEISQIDNWDERVKKIVEKAPSWDIGALSGIPSWIELMLKAVIKGHDLKNIHDIWPNLMVYTSGGVAFEPYRKSFESLMGKPVQVIDTYLASEGFIAFQSRPETTSMQLDFDNSIFFEFVPFTPAYIDEDGMPKKEAPVYTLSEVKENLDYVLIISTVSGAWRYVIGDTVLFTDKSRAEIKISGRTKHFLNVVGSQLSVSKMNDCMKHLEKEFGLSCPEYTVSAILKDEDYTHKWYLGYDQKPGDNISNERVAESMDHFLKSINKNYNVARGKALKHIEAAMIPMEVFYAWSERQKKKGGQIKVKRVMKSEEFKEWEKFVLEQEEYHGYR